MSKNAKLKKAVRARMVETGQKYTEALRALSLDDALRLPAAAPKPDAEPHYVFSPPGSIERVDKTGRRDLDVPEEAGPGFMWGYNGTGPNTAAWALLLDATGSCDPELAIVFTDDNLASWKDVGDKSFVMTVAEVAAWRREVEPRVRREEDDQAHTRLVSLAELRERWVEHQRAAASGSRLPWWKVYRAEHGEPSIG